MRLFFYVMDFMMELSALDACVDYSFDGASVTEGHLLNWKTLFLRLLWCL